MVCTTTYRHQIIVCDRRNTQITEMRAKGGGCGWYDKVRSSAPTTCYECANLLETSRMGPCNTTCLGATCRPKSWPFDGDNARAGHDPGPPRGISDSAPPT